MRRHPAPQDQAEGLRRMFARARPRFVPVVANPHLPCAAAMLEHLSAACTELELHTLVVDACDDTVPRDPARCDLAARIEPLTAHTAYLGACGLSLRHLDADGSTAGFLDALATAAPQADVALIHAGAGELARLFGRRQVRPLLLACDAPRSVTHAYAGLKLLALRGGLMAYDLLLAAAAHSPRAERIATQLARCADDFVGAVLLSCARFDPASAADEATDPALRDFVRELLLANEPGAPPAALAPRPALDDPLEGWREPAAAWPT